MNKKIILPLSMVLIVLTSCIDNSPAKEIVYISAASSLKSPVMEWEKQFEKKYPNVDVKTNFGASGVLFNQIKKGAPADLLFSAQFLEQYIKNEEDLTFKQQGMIASNELVFVSGKHVKNPVRSIEEIPSHTKLGIGDPKLVPAGYYAEKALSKVKQTSAEIVYSQNAVHLKGLVETGAVDYALMYKTDALNSDRITIQKTIPQANYPVIKYPVYDTGSQKKHAKQFISYVKSPQGQKILKKYHFRESVRN